jgi:hypothetical protein
MKLLLSICLLWYPSFVCAGQENQLPDFPSDTEIKLVMAQANRAFEQYKSVIGHAEQLLGKDPLEQDRMLLGHWETTSKTLSQNPQAFNSETGLDALVDLDDAARNTALCADQASTQVLNDLNNIHSQKSSLLLELHQSCLDEIALYRRRKRQRDLDQICDPAKESQRGSNGSPCQMHRSLAEIQETPAVASLSK